MLKHVVTWQLRDPAQRTAHVARVKEALEALRGRIPGLRAIEVGDDIGYDRDCADVVLYAEFADAAALDAYQKHPEHLQAKAIVGPLVTARRAADWHA